MNGLEVTVLLGLTILVGSIAGPRMRLPVPLALLLLGLGLGFVPELRELELPPETVLLLFLPVMLFWESLTTSLRSIRRDFRGIVILSTLLVVATAFAVAVVAHALGVPWEAAVILGAAVAPPDATAVAALGRTLPHRNFMLLKAESLTNDGTALVVYGIAVGIATGGSYSTVDVTGRVLLSYVGGIVAGVVIAGVFYLVMRSLGDPITINVALLLIPFTAYLVAELAHASGVLAVVVAGLVIAFHSGRVSTAGSRRQADWTWPFGTYLLNGALFVLIGLEVQAVAHRFDAADLGRLAAISVLVWVTLLVVRFGFQTASVALIRTLDRRPSQRARRMTYRARVVSAFAGFRGAVSLAIALSVPVMTDDGAPLEGRDDIVFITAGVILLTLLVQGPLLPSVVRWAHLPEDTADREMAIADLVTTRAAIEAFPEIVRALDVSDAVSRRVEHELTEHLALVEADADVPEESDAGAERFARTPERPRTASPWERRDEYVAVRMALLERKREALEVLRRSGRVDDSVARRARSVLDVDEIRLSGIESLE